ncbi:hypothetical protein GA0070609_2147 [Micromonospora echinaurantiaca]|uniref:Uncharacterized protein n=1 Tax=Micromonospora echinaurantiaca TaxID=47857 RepID=A0A1C5HSG7_9ACTN|nr:hypothetical protein GA0070609_2147 [Micromonospora echinaurantiaca]
MDWPNRVRGITAVRTARPAVRCGHDAMRS